MPKNLHDNHTDTLKFVHITDTHLLDHAEETFRSLNTKESLEAVLSHIDRRYPDIDFLLFTGDISQTGNEESYALFNSVIQQYDLPIYCVPGNHDTPILLQQTVPNCPGESINIVELGQFSLVLLNSWVEGEHHGMLSHRCLQQLDDHLKYSEKQFNIIAIHHPPVPINCSWLDEIALHNQTEFLQVINKHPGNALLLFGHIHQEFDHQIDSLRLLATPSTCHQFKASSSSTHHTETSQPAYRYIKLCKSNNINTKVHYIK